MGAFLRPGDREGPTGPQPGHQTGPGGGRPYLEVRAVVVVLAHNLPLSAAPDQHGDHLPPRQVCVQLRGKDVDPRGRQGLGGRHRVRAWRVGDPEHALPLPSRWPPAWTMGPGTVTPRPPAQNVRPVQPRLLPGLLSPHQESQ